MARRIIGTLLLLTIIGAAALWWNSELLRSPGRIDIVLNSRARARVFLVPLKPVPAGRRPAVDVWRTLFAEMARDAQTKALLRRLYGGLPVELFDPAPPALRVPKWKDSLFPGTELDVVIWVEATQPGLDDWSQIVAKVGGRVDAPVECLLGEWAVHRVAKIRLPSATADPATAAVARAMQSDWSDSNLMKLVAADYLLRNQTGWVMLHGTSEFNYLTDRPEYDPATARRELDREIDDWCRRFGS